MMNFVKVGIIVFCVVFFSNIHGFAQQFEMIDKDQNGLISSAENGDGYTYHKSYVQQTYKPSKIWDKYSGAELVDLYEKFSLNNNKVIEDDCEDCGFDVKNEKPYCVNCFHDLEHDSFSNYHCSSCNEWFSESEVLGIQF